MKKIVRKTILALTITAVCLMVSAVVVSAESSNDNTMLKWNQPITGGTYIQSPVYCEGNVFVGCGKNLYKFDGATGEQVDMIELAGGVDKAILPPAVADGKLFIACKSEDGKASLAIVDADTMKFKVVNIATDTGYQSISRIVYDSADEAVYMGTWSARKEENSFVKVSIPQSIDGEATVTELTKSATGFYWAGAAVSNEYVVYGSNSVSTDPQNDETATPATGNAEAYVYIKGQTVAGSDGENKPLVVSTTLEGSGSICSTAVEYNGRFLLVGKAGKLYELTVAKDAGSETGYSVSNECVAQFAGSTCTPVIKGDKAYIGTDSGITVIDLSNSSADKYTLEKTIKTPAEVKAISLCGDGVYATYNKSPGGLFDVLNEKICFEPEDSKLQNYCISSVACDDAGTTLYYTNDSRNLMAVKVLGGDDISWLQSIIANLKDQLAAKDKTISSLQSKNASLQNEVDTYKAQDRTTKITSISTKSKAITIKWAKTSGASGYRIQYAMSGKAAKTVTITSQATVTKKISSLTKGKKYTVKVQPYTNVNGKKVYGKYSAAKTITVK